MRTFNRTKLGNLRVESEYRRFGNFEVFGNIIRKSLEKGLLVSWVLGLLVSWFFISKILGFLMSTFLGFLVSKINNTLNECFVG